MSINYNKSAMIKCLHRKIFLDFKYSSRTAIPYISYYR